MESYSSGSRGVTRNLVGREISLPGFKSLTLRQKGEQQHLVAVLLYELILILLEIQFRKI